MVSYAQNLRLGFQNPKGLGSLPQSNSQKRRLRIDDPTTDKVDGATNRFGIPAEKKTHYSRIQEKTNKKLWQELTTHPYV